MKLVRSVGIVALLAITTMISVILWPVLFTAAAPPVQSFSATLSPVAGLVQYRAVGADQWVNVGETQLVNPGDQVRTGNDGFARLTVITGIEVSLYPTTLIELSSLALGQERGQLFSLTQYVGQTFTAVTQRVRVDDRIQVVLPTAGVAVRGTEFFSFVHPTLSAAVVPREDQVEVLTSNRRFTITPDEFVYVDFERPEPPPLTCSIALLNDRTLPTLVVAPLAGRSDREGAVQAFLRDFVTGNVNPVMRASIREFLELPPVDLATLTPEEDEEALQEVLAAIDRLDAGQIDLGRLLDSYRDHWAVAYRDFLDDPLAPATCGNGVQDEDETPENCRTDFTDPVPCGNNLCETSRLELGESVVNCPADCLPYAGLARSCAAVIDQLLGPLPRPIPPLTGTPTPPDLTSTPSVSPPPPPPTSPPPVSTFTPTPSGVGN